MKDSPEEFLVLRIGAVQNRLGYHTVPLHLNVPAVSPKLVNDCDPLIGTMESCMGTNTMFVSNFMDIFWVCFGDLGDLIKPKET